MSEHPIESLMMTTMSSIKDMVDVNTIIGEYEQEALALNALRVLKGEEKAKTYSGKPVWDGFKD